MTRWLNVVVVSASAIVLGGVALTAELHRPTIYSAISWETSRPHPKSETLTEGKGSEHCGWQDLTFLQDWKIGTFVRDVSGKLAAYTTMSFESDVTLPAGATFTGWHDGQRELWTDPRSDKYGPLSIYIVSPDGVERWPRSGVCF